MKSIIRKIYIAILAITSLNNIGLFAQSDLIKVVEVVRPYEPAISDAFKQNVLPIIIDTVHVNPTFEYTLKAFPLTINYDVEPIKAAKLIGEPLKKLYGSYIKIGFGNYLTPLIDIRHNSKYSKKQTYQAGFKHFSSSGKIKNDDDRKIFSGFSENNINLNGSKFLSNKTISGKFNYDNNSYYYYGYNTSLNYIINPPSFKKDMDKQQINAVDGTVNLKSNYLDSTNANYDLALTYGYFQDINKISEQNIDLKVKLNYFFENEFTGINTRIVSYNRSFSKSSKSSNQRIDNQVSNVNTLVEFNPWIGAFGPKWRIVAGVNTFYQLEKDNNPYHIYPKLSLHYNVIGYFLIPYFEYKGRIDINSFKEMLYENPYFLFPVNMKSTEYKQILTGGFRGNISSDISFNLGINYSNIKDMYFYVNDTLIFSENMFTVVYDDVKLVKIFGEISYKQSERINFLLKGFYNYYDLDNIEQAWHKPDYEITLSTKYNLKDKIIVDLNAFALGKRYAYHPLDEAIELNGIVDINLGLEYRYSKILSGFVRLNNIASTKYYQWNYYPEHRFNFMIGITYSL